MYRKRLFYTCRVGRDAILATQRATLEGELARSFVQQSPPGALSPWQCSKPSRLRYQLFACSPGLKCVHIDSLLRSIAMETTRVGIREFRAGLAEYITARGPVAVTRHGQTVGYFIPVHGQAQADLVALQQASQALDQLLAAQGVEAEDIVADFKQVRSQRALAASAKAK